MLRSVFALLALGLPGFAQAQTIPNSELIASARAACAQGDFEGFIELFAINPHVQAPFLAPRVEVRSLDQPTKLLRTIERVDYGNAFNIAVVDSYWVDAKSAAGNDADYAHLKIDFKNLPNGVRRIDYVKAEYDGQSEGDSLGKLLRTVGPRGAYIFERKGGCWQLTQDLRRQPSAKKRLR